MPPSTSSPPAVLDELRDPVGGGRRNGVRVHVETLSNRPTERATSRAA
mgnify:CR=1 FL=1